MALSARPGRRRGGAAARLCEFELKGTEGEGGGGEVLFNLSMHSRYSQGRRRRCCSLRLLRAELRPCGGRRSAFGGLFA